MEGRGEDVEAERLGRGLTHRDDDPIGIGGLRDEDRRCPGGGPGSPARPARAGTPGDGGIRTGPVRSGPRAGRSSGAPRSPTPPPTPPTCRPGSDGPTTPRGGWPRRSRGRSLGPPLEGIGIPLVAPVHRLEGAQPQPAVGLDGAPLEGPVRLSLRPGGATQRLDEPAAIDLERPGIRGQRGRQALRERPGQIVELADRDGGIGSRDVERSHDRSSVRRDLPGRRVGARLVCLRSWLDHPRTVNRQGHRLHRAPRSPRRPARRCRRRCPRARPTASRGPAR